MEIQIPPRVPTFDISSFTDAAKFVQSAVASIWPRARFSSLEWATPTDGQIAAPRKTCSPFPDADGGIHFQSSRLGEVRIPA